MSEAAKKRAVKMPAKEYVFFVGEHIKTVSLWRRIGDKEHPIYANTRGQCEWYSFDAGECENTAETKPTEAFWKALRKISNGEGRFSIEECEWYEREVVSALGNPNFTDEQRELLEFAVSRGESNE